MDASSGIITYTKIFCIYKNVDSNAFLCKFNYYNRFREILINYMEKEFIFKQLKSVAEGIIKAFGDNSEVLLHDFSNLAKSIVYIAGNVTNRKVGGPITDFVFNLYRDKGDSIQNMFSYTTRTKGGMVLKSSTIFLRDHKDKVVGCMCINIDISHFINLKISLDSIIGFKEFDDLKNIENFALSIDETIEALSLELAKKYGKNPVNMDRGERLNFIKSLDEKGVFALKGSVDRVSKILGISKYTVYNYLQEIKII